MVFTACGAYSIDLYVCIRISWVSGCESDVCMLKARPKAILHHGFVERLCVRLSLVLLVSGNDAGSSHGTSCIGMDSRRDSHPEPVQATVC